jgi:hypothetical protein
VAAEQRQNTGRRVGSRMAPETGARLIVGRGHRSERSSPASLSGFSDQGSRNADGPAVSWLPLRPS